MRRIVLAVCVALSSLASAAPARAEDPVQLTVARLHRQRGGFAWRRAVWAVDRDWFQRAVTELEASRTPGESDFTVLLLLGVSYLELGRTSEAAGVLRDAKQLAPGFPVLKLTDAMAKSALTPKNAEDLKQLAAEAIAKYDEYLAALEGYPKDGEFAAEFRYLGLVLRGTVSARAPGGADRAVADLTAARAISEQANQPPAAALVSLLAQVHLTLDQIDDAKKLVREALASNPAESVHYYNYGLILAGAHDDENARPWFEAALARRPDFAEARLKLAYIASKSEKAAVFASMRTHLEAAAAIYKSRAAAGDPADSRALAEVDSGLGSYWYTVAGRRSAQGDDAGAKEAFARAETHLKAALGTQPGCVAALSRLVQLLYWRGAPEAEQAQWKKQLDDTRRDAERQVDPFRSTFC